MTNDRSNGSPRGDVTDPVDPIRTKGWCPGVLDPMETGDGWLLRVRVPGGHVVPGLLAAAVGIGREFGSGLFDVTSRANLQIRGVPVERLEAAVAMARASGLTGRVGNTSERDALRAVIANPLSGHDPASVAGTPLIADTVVDWLVDRVDGAVPPKFGIVIDDGGTWPLAHIDADISLRAQRDGTWSVRLRGSIDPVGDTEQPLDTLELATKLCVEHGRMDRVTDNLARDDLGKYLGVQLDRGPRGSDVASPRIERILGTIPHLDPVLANVVAAPFLGRVDAATLASIAALAAEHAAALRLTPDHSFAFCGVAGSEVAPLHSALRGLGLVVDHDDARASISACVGSAGCSWARADTRATAERLAAARHSMAEDHDSRRVHLSACAKACGAPAGVRHLVADNTGTFR